MPKKKSKKKNNSRAKKAPVRGRSVARKVASKPHRKRKMGASSRFSIKNFVMNSVIAGSLGLGLKFVSNKLKGQFNVKPGWGPLALDAGIAIAIPLALHKNKKLMRYALPAAAAYLAGTVLEAVQGVQNKTLSLPGLSPSVDPVAGRSTRIGASTRVGKSTRVGASYVNPEKAQALRQKNKAPAYGYQSAQLV